MAPSANSNLPRRWPVAPVNAPRSWPNNSLSINSSGMAAQLTTTNGLSLLALLRWMALAINSFPVPLSPRINTRPLDGAADKICSRSILIALLSPTIS